MKRSLRDTLVLGCAVLAGTGVAHAENKITRGVGVEVSYTDNVDLRPEGEEESEIGVSFIGDTVWSYSSQRIETVGVAAGRASYLTDAGEFFFDPSAQFRTTVTGVRDLLYLDFNSSVGRALSSSDTRYSANSFSNREGRDLVVSYDVGPRLVRAIGRAARAELSYRFRQTLADTSRGDTTTQTGRFRIQTTEAFLPVLFTASAEYEDLKDEGENVTLLASDYTRKTVSLNAQAPLTRTFALTGTVGDENIDADSRRDDISGFFWSAGVDLRPSTRTQVTASYGERYGGDWITVAVNQKISERLAFRANASTQIEVDPRRFGVAFFIDPETGQPTTENTGLIATGIVDLEDGISVTDSASAGLIARFGRTQINISGGYALRDFETQEIERYNGNISIRRDFTKRLSARLIGRYDSNDRRSLETTVGFGGGGLTTFQRPVSTEFETYSGNLLLEYEIYSNVKLRGGYLYTERAADTAAEEYRENAAFIGAALDF
ncbi:MAG: hypothetical protein AAGC95_13155 [Pseudomonadota bacterium]